MSWTRRLAVSTGIAVAAAGIAVPLSLSTASASAGTATDPLAVAMQVQGSKLPQQLKADLKAAWGEPDGQRVAALQAVLAKAVAGAYGTEVQQRAERVQKRLAAMNPALKLDLQKAVELPKDQRRAAFKDIRQKVKDGAYGDQVKRNARILRHLLRSHRMGN
jgi:hypothetical protein